MESERDYGSGLYEKVELKWNTFYKIMKEYEEKAL